MTIRDVSELASHSGCSLQPSFLTQVTAETTVIRLSAHNFALFHSMPYLLTALFLII